MSQSKTAVFLLGAGAATAWGAKLTAAITQLILDDTEFKTTTGENLGLHLYNTLRGYYPGDPDSVNFETIIHAIEQLSNYERNRTAYGAGASFISSQPLWFEDRKSTTDVIWNFDFRPGGYINNGGTVINRANKDTYGMVPPERDKTIYLSEALRKYLSIICDEIYRYSRDCKEEHCKGINTELATFFVALFEKGYKLRVYTTNYDRLFPILFKDHKLLQFFDGFDTKAPTYEFHENFLPNIKKIIFDSESNCYYNLHGCINWTYSSNNRDIQYRFSCTPDQHHPVTINAIGANTNPGEGVIVQNIVTGYNKLQRVSLEPLNLFQSRFVADCLSADIIITSGYSFSDFHLNRSLKYAVETCQPKLLNVAWSGDQDYRSLPEFKRWRWEVLGLHGNDFGRGSKVEGCWTFSDHDKQRIFSRGLSEFLLSGAWKSIVSWL